VNDDATLMDVRKAFTEMEEAFEELAERQDEADTAIVKVLDIVQRIERMVRADLQSRGVRVDG
jgi:hypothetical protein